jgi:hypothetical protein
MRLRCSGCLVFALAAGCTGANPAFDGKDGRDASTGAEDTSTSGGVESSGTASDDATESTIDEGSGSETGTVDACELAPDFMTGLMVAPMGDATCTTEAGIIGPVVTRGPSSFSFADCGNCDCGGTPEPDWAVTAAAGLLPMSIIAGSCVEVHFDCVAGELPATTSLLVRRPEGEVLLVISHGALPETAGGWAPMPVDGDRCPTNGCPQNAELGLQFRDVVLYEGEESDAHLYIDATDVALKVAVPNAHYDPVDCKREIVWMATSP